MFKVNNIGTYTNVLAVQYGTSNLASLMEL